MTDMNRLNAEALDKVVGGTESIVNNPHKGFDYVNCRREPNLNSDIFFSIPNGTEVYPTGRVVKNNGFDWYEINLAGAYETGWVAGHLIGH